MNDIDNAGRLLARTRKGLFPPRVEIDGDQAELLEKLSDKTGQPVRELVRQALDRYFLDVESLDRSLEDDDLK